MRDRCADVEPLCSAWVDGALNQADRERVERHLRGCEACRDEVDGLRQVRELLRNLPVRRLPADVPVLAVPSAEPSHTAARPAPAWSGGQRVAAGVAVAVGLLSGAAFALGGQPPPDERVVKVPVDLYVADHLVHTVGGPLSTPVVVDSRP